MTQEASQTPAADAVIAAYLELRSRKERLTAEHNERKKKLDARMGKLEAWLQMKMAADKVNALPTDHGTAYKATFEQATVSDMDAFLDYVKSNEAWHLLEKRVSKVGVREILDAEQPLPPGVNWYTSTSINIRKPSER